MSKFNVGDVVELKGGGAQMTVVTAEIEGYSSVEVVWHNSNSDPVFSIYPEDALREHVPYSGPPDPKFPPIPGPSPKPYRP